MDFNLTPIEWFKWMKMNENEWKWMGETLKSNENLSIEAKKMEKH